MYTRAHTNTHTKALTYVDALSEREAKQVQALWQQQQEQQQQGASTNNYRTWTSFPSSSSSPSFVFASLVEAIIGTSSSKRHEPKMQLQQQAISPSSSPFVPSTTDMVPSPSSQMPPPPASSTSIEAPSSTHFLLQKLSQRLPALSDKDLLRALYLLGNRKFPKALLLSSGCLAIIDERISNMFPELRPSALVAVLGSLTKLGLRMDDLPRTMPLLVYHFAALSSSFDRRTFTSTLRELTLLRVRWNSLTYEQKSGISAGVARSATAKPSRLLSLLQSVARFGASWKDLNDHIHIVLRYVSFRVFASAIEASKVQDSSSEYSLANACSLLIQLDSMGAQWEQLGEKASLQIVRAISLCDEQEYCKAHEALHRLKESGHPQNEHALALLDESQGAWRFLL